MNTEATPPTSGEMSFAQGQDNRTHFTTDLFFQYQAYILLYTGMQPIIRP